MHMLVNGQPALRSGSLELPSNWREASTSSLSSRESAAEEVMETAGSERQHSGAGGCIMTTGDPPPMPFRLPFVAGSLRLASGPLSLILLATGLSLAATAGRAQSASPNQPLAIDGMPPAPCPLLVPKSDYALQPLRIQPSQVARKNAIGCLSPAAAAEYGPDGCPVKLCKAG
jgi:hypothetical protein